MLIIRNCRFIDFLTEGYAGKTGDILCDGERIVKIAPVGTDFGTEAEEFDADGKTVMPGLIDAHLHLYYDSRDMFNRTGITASEYTITAVRYAAELLKDGYTTVRDMGDSGYRSVQYVRDAIRRGKIPGPRVTTSGPYISSNWATTEFPEWYTCGSDGFRDACRKNFAMGADFIKLYGAGSLLMPSNEPGYPILEPDEIEAAVLVAKRNSSYVAVHAHGATSIDMCVKGGCHTIEHSTLISEDTLKYIDETKQDTALVYTLFAIDEILGQPETYNGRRMLSIWDEARKCLKNAYNNHRNILIGWGTDVSLDLFSTDPMREFRLRKEYLEMSNEDILRQATINSAKIIYQDKDIGSVKEGKYADFVIVDGDPVKDISVMYKVPAHVIKGGRVIR